ncbi:MULTISPECIES: oligoribonuclease [Halomonadaceae]|uniref:oligoribonuclease n=1 Tax=Halomonadaceae TaxID=28256 RepID=UPI001599C023|nr:MULTISPECIES: oligoribonuclease [Halomonas]QJQ95265.1 oligoribonuclease [Halomonas sp. PA5]
MTQIPQSQAVRDDLLVWIDLEMTGLDPEREKIIEVATLITDSDLNLIAEGPVLAIHQNASQLEGMDAWNQKTHGESGLIERVKNSRIDTFEAQRQTLEFLSAYVMPGTSPMCGNSVHQDRRFMEREMPQLLDFFHYRNLDVSTLKELAKRWNPAALTGFEKRNTHQALDDIRESLAELAHYRNTFLRLAPDAVDE